MARINTFVIIFTLVVNSWFAHSKSVPPLEREISISVRNESIEKILLKIEEASKVKFSYSSTIFNNLGATSIDVKQKTVREVLAVLLPKTITYLTNGNYIILKKRAVKPESKTTKITGYVYDGATNAKLSHVTVYDKKSLQSATTNEYGYYSLSIPAKNDTVFISKDLYNNGIAKIDSSSKNSLFNIIINPVSDTAHRQDSGFWKSKIQSIKNSTLLFANNLKGYINSINVKDTLHRHFQITLIPFIGTNHKLSGNVINRVSVNILGGYSKGVKGFELGGLFNINNGNMHGLQISGLTNVVGENTRGVQIAGLVNSDSKNIRGFAVAGITNYVKDTMNGMLLSGIVNTSGVSEHSFELAGITNITREAINNYQLAGIANTTSEGSNMVQIAGIYNHAKLNRGVQLALINYADSSSGVPIGLLSIVKKGIHQLEISSDEMLYANVAFRTGSHRFYNVFNAGYSPTGSQDPLWSVGCGVGTSLKINSKWLSDIILSIHHISKGSFVLATSENYKLYWGIEKHLRPKISIAFGPTFNLYMADTNITDYAAKYQSIVPYSMYNTNGSQNNILRGWIGLKAAIRFF